MTQIYHAVDFADENLFEAGALECHVPFVGAELCMEAVLDIEYAKAVVGDAPLTNIYAKEYSLLDWAKKVGGSRGEFYSPLFLPVCAYMLRSNTFEDFEPGRMGWVAG